MTDEMPITARNGEVWVGQCWLTREGAKSLLRAYEREPKTFPGRADQLRAAMAEAYHIQDEAA